MPSSQLNSSSAAMNNEYDFAYDYYDQESSSDNPGNSSGDTRSTSVDSSVNLVGSNNDRIKQIIENLNNAHIEREGRPGIDPSYN